MQSYFERPIGNEAMTGVAGNTGGARSTEKAQDHGMIGEAVNNADGNLGGADEIHSVVNGDGDDGGENDNTVTDNDDDDLIFVREIAAPVRVRLSRTGLRIPQGDVVRRVRASYDDAITAQAGCVTISAEDDELYGKMSGAVSLARSADLDTFLENHDLCWTRWMKAVVTVAERECTKKKGHLWKAINGFGWDKETDVFVEELIKPAQQRLKLATEKLKWCINLVDDLREHLAQG